MNTSDKYWLFSGFEYYPSGGMNDFVDSFQSLEDAINAGNVIDSQDNDEWWHVVDISQRLVVAESESKPYGHGQ